MYIFIGIVIILAGVAFGIYTIKSASTKMLEMQSMQTTSISDAIDIVDSLYETDPNYRHYAEVKGTIFCEEPLLTPYTGKQAVYYCAICKSVTEVTNKIKSKDGSYRTQVLRNEDELSNEKRSAECYLSDNSTQKRLFLNVESFEGDLDTEKCCDRMEHENSSFVSNNSSLFNGFSRSALGTGSRFLGYRLIETAFFFNRPVYCLGEIYKAGENYYIERTLSKGKSSVLTNKSEDSMVAEQKGQKIFGLVIIAAAAVIGTAVIFFLK